MIKLKKISIPELKELVEISYDGDVELMEKYHIQPNMGYEECVDTTVMMIEDVCKVRGMEHYKVIYNKKAVGYISKFDGFLYSFGLNKNLRKGEFLVNWWLEIKKLMKTDFATMVYRNNTRTISHLLKQGFKVAGQDEANNTISFIYSRNPL